MACDEQHARDARHPEPLLQPWTNWSMGLQSINPNVAAQHDNHHTQVPETRHVFASRSWCMLASDLTLISSCMCMLYSTTPKITTVLCVMLPYMYIHVYRYAPDDLFDAGMIVAALVLHPYCCQPQNGCTRMTPFPRLPHKMPLSRFILPRIPYNEDSMPILQCCRIMRPSYSF